MMCWQPKRLTRPKRLTCRRRLGAIPAYWPGTALALAPQTQGDDGEATPTAGIGQYQGPPVQLWHTGKIQLDASSLS